MSVAWLLNEKKAGVPQPHLLRGSLWRAAEGAILLQPCLQPLAFLSPLCPLPSRLYSTHPAAVHFLADPVLGGGSRPAEAPQGGLVPPPRHGVFSQTGCPVPFPSRSRSSEPGTGAMASELQRQRLDLAGLPWGDEAAGSQVCQVARSPGER